MKKPSTEGFFKAWNVVADDKLLRDLKDVRTRADKIRLLVSKVYHHFKEMAALGPNANN